MRQNKPEAQQRKAEANAPKRYRVIRRFGSAQTSREMLKNLLRAHAG